MTQASTLLEYSDFMHMEVVRSEQTANVVIDYIPNNTDPHSPIPIRLPGFAVSALINDYTIREEAYWYYLELCATAKRLSKENQLRTKPRWIHLLCYHVELLNGRMNWLFKFCPECNSSAPYLYFCPVCQFGRQPKKKWWTRFITNLKQKYHVG